jgi:hypothetical protein
MTRVSFSLPWPTCQIQSKLPPFQVFLSTFRFEGAEKRGLYILYESGTHTKFQNLTTPSGRKYIAGEEDIKR